MQPKWVPVLLIPGAEGEGKGEEGSSLASLLVSEPRVISRHLVYLSTQPSGKCEQDEARFCPMPEPEDFTLASLGHPSEVRAWKWKDHSPPCSQLPPLQRLQQEEKADGLGREWVGEGLSRPLQP